MRLRPGDDVRAALQSSFIERRASAAFVVCGIGSLSTAQLRLAGAAESTALHGDIELLTLSGTLSANGPHLHMSVADAEGRVWGGHVAPGCIVRTTAEVLLALLPGWEFTREPDAATGFAELVVRPRGPAAA